jgi:cytochrome b subunit of formate dehydrogenase
MILRSARSDIRAETLKTHNKLASWLFMLCTLLMLASVIRMWSHWFEISASLGISRAAGLLAVITGAALIVSWWVNTGNE